MKEKSSKKLKFDETRLCQATDFIMNNWDELMSSLPGHVHFKDINCRYVWCNHQFAKLLKLEDQLQIFGKTDYDFLPHDLADQVFANDRKVMSHGSYFYGEEQAFNTSGDAIYATLKASVRDKSGKVVGLFGFSIDITEHKRTDDQLKIENESKEKISKSIEMLASSIAHDIRTPIAVVGINVDNLNLALNKILDENDARDVIFGYIKNIKSSIDNFSNIINMLMVKLRSVVSYPSCIRDNRFNVVSMKSTINDALAEYPFYPGERGLVEWVDDGHDFEYLGNYMLTKHILFNLIKNALRAIKEIGKGKIYLNLKGNAKYNHLIFRDTATGISAKKLKNIFKPFNSNHKEGTGLGLAFCKNTMQSYGGDITCKSKEGEYAEFTLKFPKVN